MPPLDNGDIVLDPTYTNYVLQKEQADQMAQMGGGDPNDPNGGGAPPDDQEVDPEEAQQQQQDQQISDSIDDQYSK